MATKRARAAEVTEPAEQFTPPPAASPEEEKRERVALGETATGSADNAKAVEVPVAAPALSPLVRIVAVDGRERQCREADLATFARRGFKRA